jgi:hypothetical protein
MVMPNKVVKPIDSLISIGGHIREMLHKGPPTDINNLYLNLNKRYPVKVTLEKFILALDFLFSLGLIDLQGEFIAGK